jgi:IclR family pca regulon transcriptional regulator
MARKPTNITPKDPDFITSIQRGVKVIGVFDKEHPELTLREVARRSGLSPATARRFLLTFKALGYVGSNERLYVLRPKILELAYAYLNSMNVDEALQPYLREMVQRTGDSSSVTVLEGTEIVYIANSSVRRLVRLSAGVGSRFPAYPTSMGRVLLAYRSPAQIEHYLKIEHYRKITEFTETRIDKLRQIISDVRTNGYCVVQDELEVGLVSVAVPIWGPAGNVIAAMNCSSVARRTDDQEILRTRLDLLKGYAQQVSAALARFPSLAHSVASEEISLPAEDPATESATPSPTRVRKTARKAKR